MPPTQAERHPRDAGGAIAPSPDWTGPYDAVVRTLSEAFPLLPCATPVNAAAEQRVLLARWRAGDAVAPAWRAPTLDLRALARGRAAVERARATLPGATPWERVYAARLEELALELELIDAAFGPGVIRRARARWSASGAEEADAERVARAWVEEPCEPSDDDATVPTDDELDPRSLVSALRRAAGAARVPVRVLVRERIGALAASGDGVVIVARGRATTPRETERVVLHEIEGHVLPRVRAKDEPPGAPGLVSLGSAGASEDEEGRALVLEERAGFLRGGRRRALGLRHLAARHVLGGAGFVELVRLLRAEHDEPLEDALRLASRAMRGGYARGGDVFGGVARELIYLPGYLRVRAATHADERALDRLGSGRLSLRARATLGG